MSEKPWYSDAVIAFLRDDIPAQLEISPAAVARDIHTIEHRLSCEGESFLTKTLPSLGKAFDLALQGNSPLRTTAFKKKRRGAALPAFLQALLRRVFLETGWIRENPCIKTIRCLRQLFFWCKKIEKGFTDETLRQAISDFIEIDGLLPSFEDIPRVGLLGTAKGLIEQIFRHMPRLASLIPKHGPGSVATGAGPTLKRQSKHCFTSLERAFKPYHFFYSLSDLCENYELITERTKCEFGLSRTQFVEKDSSGPRTIGLEHAEYMWCQQALKGYLYDHIQSHKLTKGRVNFTDQTINRELTKRWSEYDTLDMSKASDRNSLGLVEALFCNTWLWRYLLACRSPGTILPDGQLLWFKKFAPMGSAVCFPIEAIVFFVLAVGSLVRQGFPLSIALKSVYVYGDDLVVPHGYFTGLKSDFEQFGLKFNEDKCCIAGKFRESCGLDSYDGANITPTRMKRVYPDRHTISLIPIIEHANALSKAGYWSASETFRRLAVQRFKALKDLRLPVSGRSRLPILYWHSFYQASTVRYMYKDSQCYVRGWAFQPKEVEGNFADEKTYLYESLCRRGPVGHLKRSKGRWVRTFDLRFVGTLRKKRFSVIPPTRSVEEGCPLGDEPKGDTPTWGQAWQEEQLSRSEGFVAKSK